MFYTVFRLTKYDILCFTLLCITFVTICRFITHLWQNIKYDQECNILALVYINRITLARNIALTTRNWRMVWLVAIMIAQKVRLSEN